MSRPHSEQPLLTTAAMVSPIQSKRALGFLLFSCSPIGHALSRRTSTLGGLVSSWGDSSTKPTRRFVPPLMRALAHVHNSSGSEKEMTGSQGRVVKRAKEYWRRPSSQVDTYMSIAKCLKRKQVSRRRETNNKKLSKARTQREGDWLPSLKLALKWLR